MPSRSSSRSEDEYVSSDPEAKATKPPPRRRDHDVDRHSRHNSSARRTHRSRSRSRSRSPYRAPRGEKRQREHEDRRRRQDPRTFTVRYEDHTGGRHSGHDSRASKRSRTFSPTRSRSRSPYRPSKSSNNERKAREPSNQSVSLQSKTGQDLTSRRDTETSLQKSVDAGVNGAQQSVNDEPTTTSEVDQAALIEARRKRREAIKNRFKVHESSLLVQALRVGPETTNGTHDDTPQRSVSPSAIGDVTSAPATPRSTFSVPGSPGDLEPGTSGGLSDVEMESPINRDEHSAADYDPTADMEDERARHEKRLFKEDGASTQKADAEVREQLEVVSNPDIELDMFAEDDDMLADAPVEAMKPVQRAAQALNAAMLDNWDDPEGYYTTILGELIDDRYQVAQNLGRGMFASVVRATDIITQEQVAIKIVRHNESMHKAGIKEIDILQTITANDPEDKMNVVRLHRSFEHKGHLCMVFENLSMNLREVLKKYGRDVGISLKSIRAYALQLFRGLSLLKKCQFLHADLKPDNILVNESRSSVKICDLGSASPITENATAPYLVSRFYRAPEVILGIPYDYGIDMWSIGCTLFELYTGKILFTGRNNNNMLRNIMECRGKFPNKLLRRGTLTYDYFDDLLNFKAQEPDKVTGNLVTRVVDIKAKPVRDLRSRLIPKGKKMDETERKELDLLVDLLDKCLSLSVEKRITPADALKHPFIVRPK